MEIGQITNLTPHTINVISDTENREFPASGEVARLGEDEQHAYTVVINGFDVVCIDPYTYREIIGTELKENIIVSALVAEQCAKDSRYRNVFSPDMGKNGAVRNEHGQIIGCKRLIKWC